MLRIDDNQSGKDIMPYLIMLKPSRWQSMNQKPTRISLTYAFNICGCEDSTFCTMSSGNAPINLCWSNRQICHKKSVHLDHFSSAPESRFLYVLLVFLCFERKLLNHDSEDG